MPKARSNLKLGTIKKRFSVLRTTVGITIALFLAFLLIFAVSKTPWKDVLTFLIGPLTSWKRISIIFEKMTPLLFTGTAVCIMTASGQVNMAVEASFWSGAITAAAVAMIPGIPAGLHFPLCLLAAGLVGAVMSWIPGKLYTRYGIITVVSSLMINYITLYLGLYLILNTLRDPLSGFQGSYKFMTSAKLPILISGTKIHLGVILGLLVVVAGAFILNRTNFGYCIRTVGCNSLFAKYSGISVERTIVLAQALGGLLAGMGGSVEVLGLYSRLAYTGQTQHGMDGFMIAVVAKNNPRFVPIAAFFLAYIRTSADVLNRTSSMPTELVKVVQSIVIIFVAAEKLLSGWEHKVIVRNTQLSAANVKGE